MPSIASYAKAVMRTTSQTLFVNSVSRYIQTMEMKRTMIVGSAVTCAIAGITSSAKRNTEIKTSMIFRIATLCTAVWPVVRRLLARPERTLPRSTMPITIHMQMKGQGMDLVENKSSKSAKIRGFLSSTKRFKTCPVWSTSFRHTVTDFIIFRF